MRAAKRIPKGAPNSVNYCLWLVEAPLAYTRSKILGLVIYFEKQQALLLLPVKK